MNTHNQFHMLSSCQLWTLGVCPLAISGQSTSSVSKLSFSPTVNVPVLSGQSVKQCRMGTGKMQHCKYKQARCRRQLNRFKARIHRADSQPKKNGCNGIISSRYISIRKILARQSILISSTAHNELISFYFTLYKLKHAGQHCTLTTWS